MRWLIFQPAHFLFSEDNEDKEGNIKNLYKK